MRWLDQSLNRKFVAGTAAGLLISSLVFLALFLGLYRAELEQQKGETAAQVNRLLRASLENAMLKRDLEGLRHIVGQLGAQPGIAAVMIAAPSGDIRFASREGLLGRKVEDAAGATQVITRFQRLQEGGEVLRNIHPVENQPECVQCHGPVASRPVNGVLIVDYDAAPLRANARDTTLLLLGSGSLVTLLNIAGGWWFMRRFVLRPVGRLAAASHALAAGDLTARVGMAEGDELARLGVAFDRMAERLQRQMEQLREKESFLQGLVDAIPDGVRVIDPEYRILLANRAYRLQLGLDESPDRAFCYASSHGRDTPCPRTLITCPLHALREADQPVKALHRHIRRDGSALEVEVYAAPMRIERNGETQMLVVESIRDLAAEIQYSQEQKMAEIGMLAAGVAHEIYNPLTSIRFALHAAREALEGESPDLASGEEYLGIVDREVDQCIGITERLLRLSVAPPAEPELVLVNQAVAETASLLRWEAETCRVRLEVVVAPDQPRIWATDSELRMLTLNLMQNALHAMPQGGELRLEVERGEGWVEVRIQDSGVGIDPELHGRIFDPFYSRRANGTQGAGLGLAICKNIVERHGGSIRLHSVPGAGSLFAIRFPDAG